MTWGKLALTGTVALGSLGVAYTTPTVVNEVRLANVPQELRLKVPADRVLADRVYEEYTEFDRETGLPVEASKRAVALYAFQSDRKVKEQTGEVVALRTVNTRTFTLEENKYVQESTLGQKYIRTNDVWYEVDYATTTQEVFELEARKLGYVANRAWADDTGFQNPGTVTDADNDAACGAVAWGLSGTTEDVKTSNDTRYFSQIISLSGTPMDHLVKLVQSGSKVGDDKVSDTTITTTDQVITYGGAADTWGVSLDDTDVNDSGFGFAYSQERDTASTYCLHATNHGFSVSGTIDGVVATVETSVNGTSRSATVDHMTMKVYYTAAAASPAPAQDVIFFE